MEGFKAFVHTVLSVLATIWGLIRAPFVFLSPFFSKIFRWYRKIWVKYTYNKYDEFVYKKGVATALVTLACLVIIPMILCFLLRTGYYFATCKKERIYLIQSEEIYPDDNVWAVRGCYHENCDSDTSLYYRIEPSLFHQTWNIINHGNIFLPDAIGASVPTGLTQCEVVSYGLRLRILMTFNIYPNILQINCEGDTPVEK